MNWQQVTDMKQIKMLIGVTAVAISATVLATEAARALPNGETNEQKCGRWADYDSLQGDKRAEFLKDCLIDLKVPDAQEEGGDE